jgi:hypothetical protein
MGNVVISLLPLIAGSAILPVGIIIVIIMLMGENGPRRALAFIGGLTLMRLIQGVLFGYVFGASAAVEDASGPSPVTSTLLIMVGLLFVMSGIKTYRNEPDLDDPPPKWMTMVDSLTVTKALLVSMGWVLVAPKLWAFTLSAISTIREADLSASENVIAYLIYMIGCVLIFLILLIIDVVAPEQSKVILARLRGWLEKNNRVIMIVLSAVFGVAFLYKGITGLIG